MPRYKLIKLSGVFDILAPILTSFAETKTLLEVMMVMMTGALDTVTTITTPAITRIMMGAAWQTLTPTPGQ